MIPIQPDLYTRIERAYPSANLMIMTIDPRITAHNACDQKTRSQFNICIIIFRSPRPSPLAPRPTYPRVVCNSTYTVRCVGSKVINLNETIRASSTYVSLKSARHGVLLLQITIILSNPTQKTMK